MKHVAVYTRETKARGREDNVEVQAEKGTGYAQARWPGLPVEVYCDNDITAADPGTFRPDYDRLLTNVRGGKVAHVVSADQERLTRQLSEWEQLCATLRDAEIWEVHGYRDGITPVKLGQTAAGRYKAVAAAEYVEGVKLKVLEKHETLAAEGRPSGGRQLGYRPGRDEHKKATLEVVPDEADAIRWAADAVLRHGWSLTAVGEEWERRGIEHPRRGRRGHKAWHAQQVRPALIKPSVAGLRIVDGREVKATWPPILDVKTWRRLRNELDARREANRQTGRRKARRYLLTGGFAVCGLCGDPHGERLRAGWRRDKGAAYYECIGCHRSTVRADALEAHVTDEFHANLDNPKFWEALASDGHETERQRITDALADIDTQRGELGRMWARRDIDAAGWAEAGRDLDRQTTALHSALAALPPPAVDVDPETIRDGWDAMTLDERRYVLGLFLDHVIVYRARPGVRRFEPSRVRIVWRD